MFVILFNKIQNNNSGYKNNNKKNLKTKKRGIESL